MTAGLNIWNENGVLILDATSRCGRIKGAARCEGFDNSVIADLSDGTPFYSFQPDFLFKHISGNSPPPIISISASGVSWSYSPSQGANFYPLTGNLFYGVY